MNTKSIMFVISILTLSVFACSGGEGNNKIADTEGQPIQDVRPFNDGCILETNEGDTSIDSGEDTGDYGVDISIDTDEDTQDISDISDAREEDIIGDIETEIDYGVDIDTSEDVEYESDILVDGSDASDIIDNDTGGNEVQPAPNSIIDTISLNPSGNEPGMGYDSFPADPSRSGGYNVRYGFAFKLMGKFPIDNVEFMIKQTEIGGGLVVKLYKAKGGSDPTAKTYWQPNGAEQPLAIFDLDSTFPLPENNVWTIVRFKIDTPFFADSGTPYVIVLDALPDSNGQGQYAIPKIPAEKGYLSNFKIDDEVFMPSYVIRSLEYFDSNAQVFKNVWIVQDDLWRPLIRLNFRKDVHPTVNSVIDTISFNPHEQVLSSLVFGAGTDAGIDYAMGFAIKVLKEQSISAIEFLAKQIQKSAGIEVKLYKGSALSGYEEYIYWMPRYDATPEAIFNLATPLPEEGDGEFRIFRFEVSNPYTLQADTPYVAVFDPEPTSDGRGEYVMPSIPEYYGFLSYLGEPNKDVFMPPYLVVRRTYVQYNNHSWDPGRGGRFLIRVLSGLPSAP